MTRPNFIAYPKVDAKTGNVEVFVARVDDTTSHSEILTPAEARDRAMKLLEAADIAEGRPLFIHQGLEKTSRALFQHECYTCGQPCGSREGLIEHQCQGAESTRRQCQKCLNDCSKCSCVEDVISRGKGG